MLLVDAGHEMELRRPEFMSLVNAGKTEIPIIHAMTILGISRLFVSFEKLPPLMWLNLQQDLTTLSTDSRRVFADRSSHFIQFDQPALVTEAIHRMIDTVRQAPPAPQS